MDHVTREQGKPLAPTPPTTPEPYRVLFPVGIAAAFVALREETGKLAEGEWQIAPEQGPFLAMLVQLMGASKCLEIGTFTGYSAMWVAGIMQGLMWRAVGEDGTLTSPFVGGVKAPYPFYAIRLLGGLLKRKLKKLLRQLKRCRASLRNAGRLVVEAH